MSRPPLTYLTTLPMDETWLADLRQRVPDVELRQQVVRSADEIDAREWADVDVLHTGSVLPLPEQAPRLRWMQLDTSGAEHVAATAWWGSEVEITTLGGVAPVPMAEFTVMSLLSLAHHQPLLDDVRRSRRWPDGDERLRTMTPLPVDGATAVIVGYGRIGREVSRILRTLGVEVVGLSRRGPRDVVVEQFDTGRQVESDPTEHRPIDELLDVLPRADYLVVVAPRTAHTVGLIGAAELARLREGACLVDVSRGGVVDEAAVLRALESGQLRYAALDVLEHEPPPAESPWWDHPRVLLTPHVAGLAPRYREQVLDLVSTNLVRFSAGLPLMNRVDRAAGY